MPIIKCKMCGGDLNIVDDSTVCECEYCGTKQTVPKVDDEKKLKLFERANRLRTACEFDKAAGVYESIVADFDEEAEAYWGLILCKFGIEYVDDPATGNKVPTCHRSSFDSLMDDPNFDMVMECADPVARWVYREEAKQIEELRKRIIEVSAKEEPYDVFISYKEQDGEGQRTLDSVIAQDIYTELTEKDYRVFFSRISLEDKLGVEYEPYIFAALNSAKVMLVVGTDYDYFNAVWVKNEWSRFLSLIAKGEKKTLIPVFKGIDAYDMPKEFRKLAAQDMGKVGAMQDLVRGVEKLLGKKRESDHATQAASIAPSPEQSLLKRAELFLESGNWEKAEEYAERVLDSNPENARAYLMKELAVQNCQNIHILAEKFYRFGIEDSPAMKNARRFADDSVKQILSSLDNEIDSMERFNAQKQEEARRQREADPQMMLAKEKVAFVRERGELLSKRIIADIHCVFILNSDGRIDCTTVTDDKFGIFDGGKSSCKLWSQTLLREMNVDVYRVMVVSMSGRLMGTNPKHKPDKDRWLEAQKWDNIRSLKDRGFRGYIYGLTNDASVKVAGTIQDTVPYHGQDQVENLHNIEEICFEFNGRLICRKTDLTLAATPFLGSGEDHSCWDEMSQWSNIIQLWELGGHVVGKKSDGTLIATRYAGEGEDRTGWSEACVWTDIVHLNYTRSTSSEGDHRTVGLNDYGEVLVTDYYGKDPEDPKRAAAYKQIAQWKNIARLYFPGGVFVGLHQDGTVVTSDYFGDPQYHEKAEDTIKNWNNIAELAFGYCYVVGVKKDGTLIATEYSDDHGATNVHGLRIFRDYEHLPEEIAGAEERAEAERRAAADRAEAERRAAAEKAKAERKALLTNEQSEKEKRKTMLEKELPTLTGIFKAGKRREAEAELAGIETRLAEIETELKKLE